MYAKSLYTFNAQKIQLQLEWSEDNFWRHDRFQIGNYLRALFTMSYWLWLTKFYDEWYRRFARVHISKKSWFKGFQSSLLDSTHFRLDLIGLFRLVSDCWLNSITKYRSSQNPCWLFILCRYIIFLWNFKRWTFSFEEFSSFYRVKFVFFSLDFKKIAFGNILVVLNISWFFGVWSQNFEQ